VALQGCAVTTSLLGLGKTEKPTEIAAATACAPGAEQRPLASVTTISGDLRVRSLPAAGAGDQLNRVRLISPVAVAAQASDVYIADVGHRTIFKYDRGTQTIRVFVALPDMNTLTRLYVDRALSLYVTDPVGAEVVQYDIDGRPLQSFRNSTELTRPAAAVVDDARGEILVGDRLSARILVFNRGGLVVQAIGAGVDDGVYFQSIVGMALGTDQLYVVDQAGRQVFALAGDGSLRYTFGSENLVLPGAIALDAFNRVFVADNGDRTIKVFRGGALEAVVGASGDPAGLRFNEISDLWAGDGLLYVADPARASVEVLRIEPPCE
jgi:hypothetical protein